MKVYIKNINVWLQGLDNSLSLTSWANNELKLAEDFIIPKPQYYPKGQLRRLSPFSKIALHCLDIPAALSQNLPLIFASQHGDLAKTITLIKDAALGEDLSPTKFALSVHNATSGLFSIATNNTAATTTISAGANTFFEGLIEASMQCQQTNTQVIYSYCDLDVPEEYRQFEQEKPARCITMILSSKRENHNLAAIDIALNNAKADSENTSPAELSFIRHFYSKNTQTIASGNYLLSLDFKSCS